LKASRAYIAGVGTTGVLIGSFLLLLTVGSALVAFQGVPGQATNGDLSSIELLRQQSERAGGGDAGLLAASGVLGARETGFETGASSDVFGARAAGSQAAGRILGATGSGSGDALRPGAPALNERLPSGGGQTTSPSTGAGTGATTPVTSGDTPVSSDDTGTGSDTTTDDTSTGTGSGSTTTDDTGTGSGTTGDGTGSGGTTTTDDGSGTGSGGTTTTDDGSGTGSGGSGSGGATEVVDPVTDTVGGVAGSVSGSTGTTTDTTGGLLDDVTSVVGGLTG
jgi:hypothetical protein